jgi:pyruvate formate lyase activating enzyme
MTHVRLTAAPNAEVLESIRYLASIDRLYEVRLSIMPGYNDDPVTVDRTAEWLRGVDPAMRIVAFDFSSHGLPPEYEYLEEAAPAPAQQIGEWIRRFGFTDVVAV